MKNSIAFLLYSSVKVEPQKPTRVLFPKGMTMDTLYKINDLEEMPDCFLLGDRIYQGQEGAILIIVNTRVYKLITGEELSFWPWWFIPMDKYLALVTMFEQEGLELSYG